MRSREEQIHLECMAYLDSRCAKFGIRDCLLVFDDRLQNPGACGEAGQSTIWIQRNSAVTATRPDREAVLRRELAHIAVHNNPALGNVETRGPEFEAELARISSTESRISSSSGLGWDVLFVILVGIAAAVIGYMAYTAAN